MLIWNFLKFHIKLGESSNRKAAKRSLRDAGGHSFFDNTFTISARRTSAESTAGCARHVG